MYRTEENQMKCKNCGKDVQLDDLGIVHTDGFFACRITGLFPSIAEVVEGWDGTTAREAINAEL